jgi:hypothetical protein
LHDENIRDASVLLTGIYDGGGCRESVSGKNNDTKVHPIRPSITVAFRKKTKEIAD